VTSFKAIELDAGSRQRTGRAQVLDATTRQAAIDDLLRILGVSLSDVRVDPTRTMVQTAQSVWTIVAVQASADAARSSLRRGGAKHKHVR